MQREQPRRAPRAATPPAPIDVTQYVRECLDGAVGDIDLPASYPFAQWEEPKVNGCTAAQAPVYRQIEAALVRRFRPLTLVEQVRLGMAFVIEWNRRAAIQEDRDRRREWLEDFQAGDHGVSP